jgi:hypothetical protein
MDWLKAASVVALGMMTAILKGAATAPTDSAIASDATANKDFPLILLSLYPGIRRGPTPTPFEAEIDAFP